MPPWTIVLAGTAVAIAVAAALVIPEVAETPRSEIGVTLLPQLPALAVAVLAVYGLVALALTTTSLVTRLLRVHRNLGLTVSGQAIARRDWIAALAAKGFRPSAAVAPEEAEAAGDINTGQGGLTVQEARGEIARRHYISLARTHFFSVLIVLVGIVGLGAAQDFGTLRFWAGTLPTVSAILVVVGLLLLAVLSRIAVDVAAEPLLERIAQSSAEPVEVGLLRRILALQEAAGYGEPGEDGIGESPDRLPVQIAAAFEQGHRALLDAVTNLAENSRALEATIQSAIETAAAQQRTADSNISILATLPDLQNAVEELTAVLRRLSAAPERTEEPAFTAAVPSRRTTPAPGLARELRRLLQEIDAAR